MHRRSFDDGAIRKKNRAITGRKEVPSVRRSRERNGNGMCAKGAVKEFAQLAHACGQVGVDRQGPEGATWPNRKFQMGSLALKSRDVCIRSSRKEKELIEVALADGLGVTSGEACVLNEFS